MVALSKSKLCWWSGKPGTQPWPKRLPESLVLVGAQGVGLEPVGLDLGGIDEPGAAGQVPGPQRLSVEQEPLPGGSASLRA